MNPATTLPMDWKPLREAAEANAREAHDAVVRYFGARGEPCPTWDEVIPEGRAARIAGHAALLADLTRPASRDFWARWLAEKVGLTVGATAPGWYRHAAAGRTHWQIGDFPMSQNVWVVDHAAEWNMGARIVVPGISTLTDPAAALRAALLAVVPA